jgi:16S rRNA (guanine966-N2)-methyltransferase
MSDKVRGALFNMLGDVEGLTFLDAFTGSGAISFEALSRGAHSTIAVDIDKSAITIVDKNARKLGASKQIHAIQANASGWSDNNESMLFDIVVCDPPYDKLQLPTLEKLTKHLSPTGVYVLSWPGHAEPPDFATLKLVTQKDYGDAQLLFYKAA